MITKDIANAITEQNVVATYDSVITDAFKKALELCITTAAKGKKYQCTIESLPGQTECVVRFLRQYDFKVRVKTGGKDKITIYWR